MRVHLYPPKYRLTKMRKANAEKAINKFLSNPKYEDLINKYEEQTGEILSDLSPVIIQIYNEIANQISIKFDVLIEEALRRAVKDNVSILDTMANIRTDSHRSSGKSTDILQTYFNEISRIYARNNNECDIEYCEENREKLLQMNLKSVIAEAKKYQGLGVDFEDLIAAGNKGLCIAWDKYDPKKAKLKENIIARTQELSDEFSYGELHDALGEFLAYGSVKRKFDDKFKEGSRYTKDQVIEWINKNITNAKFNSVATMWIKAYIHIELNDNSRLVKKPKIEITKDRERDGYYSKEKLLCIDSPVSDDSDTPLGDILCLNDDTASSFEIDEAYKVYKENLRLLLTDVRSRDRGILMKKFGIGLPRPMQPDEISEQEGLSIARISQILQDTIMKMQENAIKYNVDPSVMYQALNTVNES